ncbi:hypothetical protein JL721_1883 [Aureococcus anophagefferens]|nr:hypothetical protein JL721_1883 [Aureococcus anophagefferens]
MSVFASPSKTTVDMDEINKVLWPVYVRAALRGATISRCEVVGTVQKREWLKLLRGGGLDGAQATLVYYAETAKHERRCFTYSAFKRALRRRVPPGARAPAARGVRALRGPPRAPLAHAVGGAHRRGAGGLRRGARRLRAVPGQGLRVLRHGPYDLRDESPPAPRGPGGRGPHAAVADLRRLGGLRGDLRLRGSVGPGRGVAIFVDSVAVEAADELGGLTLEEFHDAVLRAALLVSATPGGGSEDIPGIDLALKPRRSARGAGPADADALALAADAAPQRALAGFRVMRSTLERTVPRATNAGHGTCAGSAGGEARWAGGRAVSSNYSLLIEGSKEFSTLADQCWSNLKKNTAKLLASTRRATSRGEELTDLMDDLTMTRPAPDAAGGGRRGRLRRPQPLRRGSVIFGPRSSAGR